MLSSRCLLRTPLTALATVAACSAALAASSVAPGCAGVDTSALGFDAGAGAASDAAPVGDAGNVVRGDGASGMCMRGLILCGSACVDPATDPLNCGGCEMSCGAGGSCNSGTCGCTPGTPGCGSPIGNPDACGAARATCGVTQACVGGACQCLPGLMRIGDACVDLLSDPNNCGAPGVRCAGGVCSGGHCTTECSAPRRACEGACVDIASDVTNCGECGRTCDRGQLCVRGGCHSYRSAGDCLSCPCASSCTGEFPQCCPLPGTATAICVATDHC